MLARLRVAALSSVLLLLGGSAFAAPITLNFDSLSDGQILGGEYLGLIFSNATAITAGISLNEFDFPPRSGTNVIFDDGGPMSISFASAVYSLAGYFTYAEPVTLTAFDAGNNMIGSATSAFLSNYGSSGTPGATTNELLSFSSLVGISSVILTGSNGGGSFVLDDLTYDDEAPTTAQVPEPSTFGFMLLSAASLLGSRRLRRTSR